MKNNDSHLRLFVYGTLKKGFWNFDRFCTRAISIEPATTWGRLYHLPAGFPALEVPESSILVTATADRLEAFDPNGRSMYQRVLVAAECQDQLLSCWTYHGLNHILRGSSRFSNGYWDGKKFG